MDQLIENILNNNNIYAHEEETLYKHTKLCLHVYDYFNKALGIENKIIRVLENIQIKNRKNNIIKFNENELSCIKEMMLNIVKFHDLGKCNLQFQKLRMKNNIFDDILNNNNIYSNHSGISTLLYVEYYFEKIENDNNIDDKKLFKHITLIFANIIYSHHTYLHDLIDVFGEDGQYYDIKNQFDNINVIHFIGKDFKYINSEIYKIVGNKDNNKIFKNFTYDESKIYIISKILYSILINCDFIATKLFKRNERLIEDYNINRIEDIDKVKKCFNDTVIKKNIDNYIKNNNTFDKTHINTLRCEIASKTYINLVQCKYKKRIYFIKAPTGSGKTYNSLNCILELLDDTINKILYVFPINAISNQTKKVFDNIFKNILPIYEINSSSEIPLESNNNESEVDFNNILLDKQQMNYPFILTSNIKLFDSLFGKSRESNLSLIHLCNSVIVLDEIQNYNNKKWKEIIEMLYEYSDILNLKIIIMSATLPALNELLEIDDNIINLTPDANKWFSNPLFKDRVEIDTEIMYKTVQYEDIKEKMIKEINIRNEKENCKSKFLIEFISKKRAREFYDYIKEELDPNEYLILGLDSLDNKIRKDEIIKICQEENKEKNIILVSTQVIEAGVDIDMDLGAKDISFPDLDEQFMGRINRNCNKRNCKVFFFNMTDSKSIYKNDYRQGIDILDKEMLSVLNTKDFNVMYSKVFKTINNVNETYKTINQDFKRNLKQFNYSEIEKYMKLIEEDGIIQVYIPQVLEYENGTIDGYKLIEEFKELINSKLDYCEKTIKLYNMYTKLNLFMYNIYETKDMINLNNIDTVGGIYYIENDKFIKDNRLDLERLEKYLKGDDMLIS
ncbi:CRISPR-associated helicase Cas3' [Clostridium ihumii]|uniref:CRISPR-associated helicase Cas3' n=1 Tax=Clostridium ihumii TaxID=1470356 RepID=UPI003D342F5A